jgi:hypothetical protein
VLFETEQDLVVMRSQLQAVIVHQGGQYCDQILAATTGTASFPVFEIEQPNTIYIGADQLTTKSDSKEIQLAIADAQNLIKDWQWSYWDGETWQVLTPKLDKDRLTLNLPESLSKPQSKVIEGEEAQWLRGISPEFLPSLDPKMVKLVRAAIQATIPDKAFFNTEEIDLSKDFYPLGETPRFNDTFYIASSNILNLASSEVTLHFESSSGIQSKPSNNPAPSIIWETWNGESWTSVYTGEWDTKTFKMPNKVEPVEVNGEKNYWLRARLIAGNYGGESQLELMEYILYTYTSPATLPEQGRGTINILQKDNAYKVRIFNWNGNKDKDENLNPNDTLKTELSKAFSPSNQPLDEFTKRELSRKIQAYLNYMPEPIFQYRSSSELGYFPPCLKSVKLSRSEIADITPKPILQALPSAAFIDNAPISIEVETILYIEAEQIFTLSSSTGIKLKEASMKNWDKWKWSCGNGKVWQKINAVKDDKDDQYITLKPAQSSSPQEQEKPVQKDIEVRWLRGVAPGVLPQPKPSVIFPNPSSEQADSTETFHL